jgi:hypothetical protein
VNNRMHLGGRRRIHFHMLARIRHIPRCHQPNICSMVYRKIHQLHSWRQQNCQPNMWYIDGNCLDVAKLGSECLRIVHRWRTLVGSRRTTQKRLCGREKKIGLNVHFLIEIFDYLQISPLFMMVFVFQNCYVQLRIASRYWQFKLILK